MSGSSVIHKGRHFYQLRGIAEDGSTCYIQSLIGSGENAKVMYYHGPYFPRPSGYEILLQAAFTPERFGGKGIVLGYEKDF